jgi:hypothetical protein
MREWLGVACFASAFFFGTATWAADVQSVQGDLSINQGQGFQAVNGRLDANVGDSVMVGPGGSATVSYPDGCQVPVQPGAVTTIAPLSPCASASFAQGYTYNPQDTVVTSYIVGGIIAASIAGLAIAIVTHKNSTASKPISP